MLPEYLTGTYKLYKSDTAEFTTWLQTTAESRGFVPSAKTSNGNGSSSADAPTTNQVPLSRFIPLAKHIAQSKPRIRVPKLIAALIIRAIELRKRCSAWFRKNARHQRASNKQHLHFVSVLEDILEILSIKVPLDEGGNEKSSNGTKDLGALNNIFDALDLEDTVDDETFEGTPQETQPKTRKDKPETYDMYNDYIDEGEDSLLTEEVIFKLFCLLSDLKNIREFVSSIWSEYRLNKADLMSTAVTTNTAIDLARQSCKEFTEQYPKLMETLEEFLGGRQVLGEPLPSIPSFLYFYTCAVSGISPINKQDGDPYNFAVADVAEFTYLNTDVLLRSFCDVLGESEIPMFKEGYFGVYNPKRDRSKLNSRQRFNDDKIILMQSMTNFSLLSSFNKTVPGEDEITKGLKNMNRTREVPLWLAFATQIYLDIHSCLREDVQKAWQDLRFHALRAKKNLEGYFAWKTEVEEIPMWHKANDQIFKGIQKDCFEWVENDVFSVLTHMKMLNKNDDRWGQFLKWHPLQAGTLAFNINLRMQEAGLTLVNVWGNVINAAYLLNALEQAKILTPDWPDMDLILRYHGEDHIFFGKRPKDLEESMKKIQLLAGASPAALAAIKSGKKTTFNEFLSSRGQRCLKESTTIAAIFREHYCRGNARSADLSIANMERVLNELTEQDSAIKWRYAPQLPKVRWQRGQKLSPLQLLAALRARLFAEEAKLMVDYFGLQRRVFGLLRALHTKFEPKFVQYWGASPVKHDYEVSAVILCIFTVALGSAELARQTGLNRRLAEAARAQGDEAVTVSKMLQQTAKFMEEEWMEKNGAVMWRELKVFCKNKREYIVNREPPPMTLQVEDPSKVTYEAEEKLMGGLLVTEWNLSWS